MSLIDRVKQMDYDYSYKLAQIFNVDSPVRVFFRIATLTGTYIFWGIVLILIYIFAEQYRLEVLTIVFISSIMLLPVFILKHTTKRSRPDYKDTRFASIAFDKYSFPSGHATRATYVMILMPMLMPGWLIFWIIWGLTMIFSRLILGVHYISDILTAIFLSAISMWIFYLLDWIPVFPWAVSLLDLIS